MRATGCFAKTKTVFKEIKAKLENFNWELGTIKYGITHFKKSQIKILELEYANKQNYDNNR